MTQGEHLFWIAAGCIVVCLVAVLSPQLDESLAMGALAVYLIAALIIRARTILQEGDSQ